MISCGSMKDPCLAPSMKRIFLTPPPPLWKFQLSIIHFFQQLFFGKEFPIPSVGEYGDFLERHFPVLFFLLFRFLFLQVFYPPSRSSFMYQNVVHKAGEEKPPDREYLNFYYWGNCRCVIIAVYLTILTAVRRKVQQPVR